MILPAMLAVMSLFSCSDKEENDVIGDYKPIEVNKEVMEIPAEGGSDTIRITNVTGWKIYEVSVYVDGQLVEKPEPTQEYILYEGDWYTIKNIDLDKLVAIVDSTMSGKDYEIKVSMVNLHLTGGKKLRVIPKK